MSSAALKEIWLVRLDWTRANAPIGLLHPAHIGVFATMEARIKSPSLLIIAAPIKKPYIWDLTPSTSSIRFCLRQGLHVQLLEWLSASSHAGNYGIDDYVLAISEAVATSTATAKGAKPHMIGHSLGGTLAAIYGAFQPESIKVSCFWARHSVSSRRRVSFATPLFHWSHGTFPRTSHFRVHSCRRRARSHLQIHLFGRA